MRKDEIDYPSYWSEMMADQNDGDVFARETIDRAWIWIMWITLGALIVCISVCSIAGFILFT